jgi:hypothetical protein
LFSILSFGLYGFSYTSLSVRLIVVIIIIVKGFCLNKDIVSLQIKGIPQNGIKLRNLLTREWPIVTSVDNDTTSLPGYKRGFCPDP